MENTDKTTRPIKLFESTYELINRHKGKKTIALFIDEAVGFYLRATDGGDPYARIVRAIEQINDRQTTNLGLLCEVLRQQGILNGNGEVNATRRSDG